MATGPIGLAQPAVVNRNTRNARCLSGYNRAFGLDAPTRATVLSHRDPCTIKPLHDAFCVIRQLRTGLANTCTRQANRVMIGFGLGRIVVGVSSDAPQLSPFRRDRLQAADTKSALTSRAGAAETWSVRSPAYTT